MLHKPVLMNEVISSAMELKRKPMRILDGTFGRGGHTHEFFKSFPEVTITAFDRDAEAVAYANERFKEEINLGRLNVIQINFADTSDVDIGLFDFILLDLGVSSPQLEDPNRGFSFYKAGPLDMRMDTRELTTAHEIVNFWDQEDLIELFKKYGEVRSPQRVVRAIVEDRKAKLFETTEELAQLIARVDGWRKKGHHPATQYFLALRIKVNHEFEDIERGLKNLVHRLQPLGRLAVITFHSSEDRIVKYLFKEFAESLGSLVNKKVIVPSREEEKENPRARSAKLRIFERSVQ